jgi:hypothetical protein
MSDETDALNAPNAGNWDEDFVEKPKSDAPSDRRKAEYMDTSEPGSYRVRLAGPHVKFRKHWKPFRATVKDDGKAVDPAWQAGFVPGKRFAINVIDKTGLAEGEVGKLKILEKGAQVFKNFSNYKVATGTNPAEKDGPDFIITVTVPMGDDGKPNKMKTEYSVIPVDKAPFTEAEKALIKAEGLFPLKEIYKPVSPEKLQELWDELPEDKKIAPPKPWDKDKKDEKKEAPKQEAPKETETPSDTELFEAKTADGDSSADLF